jgi:hypothetical protein
MLFRGNEIHIAGQQHPVVRLRQTLTFPRGEPSVIVAHGTALTFVFVRFFHYFYVRSPQPALTVYLRRLSALTFFFLG